MPTKTVTAAVEQGSGFRTECKAGKHTLIIDQPSSGGGTDGGPSPLEYQLFALGGCLAAIGRIVANQQKLNIRGFKISLEGTINTDRLLGKPSPDRIGFSAIKASVQIDADLSKEQKAKLLHEIDERCPISDNIQNTTSLTIVSAD